MGGCETCMHCDEVMGDSVRCGLNWSQTAAPLVDECVHHAEAAGDDEESGDTADGE